MRLRDLDASFVAGYDPATGSYHHTGGIAGAQGVLFQCPKCAAGLEQFEEPDEAGLARRGVRGAHYVLCWFADPVGADPIPPAARPGPGRWHAAGTGLDDLTFTGPHANSVSLTGPGCGWHGFVTNGEVA